MTLRCSDFIVQMYMCTCVCALCIRVIIHVLQRLLAEAEKSPNVVKCTNRKGLYEELEDIQGR